MSLVIGGVGKGACSPRGLLNRAKRRGRFRTLTSPTVLVNHNWGNCSVWGKTVMENCICSSKTHAAGQPAQAAEFTSWFNLDRGKFLPGTQINRGMYILQTRKRSR